MRALASLSAVTLLVAAACSDLPTAVTAPSADAPPGESFRAELHCTASVAQPGLSCGVDAGAAGGAPRTLIIGGQNVYVRLEASGAGYNPSDSIFQMYVTVENLMTQVFGSPDGEIDTGLRIFFHTLPVATLGTGNVEVDNEDGSDFFMSPDQPYFTDTGLLYTGDVSEGKTWEFKVDPDVQTFYFSVFVQGELPHEPSLLRFSPFHTNEEAYFTGIWAPDAANTFAVGAIGDLAHYAGGVWTDDESPTAENLWDVFGTSATDVFAVGDAGTIVHWNGTDWQTMASGLECTCETLYGVWASGPSDAYAVGDGGVIVHYDGSDWVAGDTMPVAWLGGVWGSAPNDVFAVGDDGGIFHYDGASWTPMTSGLEGTGEYLNTVWGLSSTDVYAAASNGVLHYDGVSWSSLPGVQECEHYSVWGTSPSNLFVANVCGIDHFDGSTWAYMDPGGFVTDLWGTGPVRVLANTDGYVFRGTR
jgi:hypothetical protein